VQTISALQVAVIGGTGYLGREIVAVLLDKGHRVRVACRHPLAFSGLENDQRLEAVRCDLLDEASVREAVAGVDAVINAASLYAEKGALTFDAIHVQGAERVARCAREAGVERLIHFSGIGARADSPSAYIRARFQGEQVVKAAFDPVTILRPSALFGNNTGLLDALDLVSRLPVVPLFGRGNMRLQPVYVGDVAQAVRLALKLPEAAGKTYELGGGKIYTYREAVKLVMADRQRKRPLVPVPLALWHGLAVLLSPLPNPPLTRDQLYLLAPDNVVGARALTFTDLALPTPPLSLEDKL
jgi:NADH dehydrogenase